MKGYPVLKVVAFALLVLILNACSNAPVDRTLIDSQKVNQVRLEQISGISNWSIKGRISLDDGEDGGSGKIQWSVQGDKNSINFHGAMGRGAWHLESDSQGARLTLADGSEYVAADVDALVQQHVGWPVPVAALQWWVRGLAAPGTVDGPTLNDKGLPDSLQQDGWQIKFNRYSNYSDVAMPVRLDARSGSYRIKLAVSHWQLDVKDVVGL